MKKIIIILLSVFFMVGCSRPGKTEGGIFVSILPLKYIVDRITGSQMEVRVLVPPGVSPERFEPTPVHLKNLEKADVLYTTGLLDFESALTARLDAGREGFLVDISTGIDLIHGHGHSHTHSRHSHSHSVDPHIWNAPQELIVIAGNIYRDITDRYGESDFYRENYLRLEEELRQLDSRVSEMISGSGTRMFIIYHPALTYYARDYGIRQVSIENEGKEPSADALKKLITEGRQNNVRAVLYQRQFSSAAVSTLAGDLGAEIIEFDPLAENVIENIMHITTLITAQ